ncbi:MAG: type I-E CRISPR-associated protein Cas7/Cse4/CasC [Acidobacteria bacterium]|nr:type I-E CRISPR-associated protein Cas7/Cse4/CasC [Acidobacteriota bacterium]MYA44444.1 type I-E CRISPR-associated protein Cas7/Cse4/CasC [Gemmatimonadota bacterium]MYJ26596.1 type I-E CRISPR-associated protein Cas7/Cse4/CasC [Holophagales bacterium]
MSDARFLQIHSLHGYSAVLLNRDDSGLAKRILYGDAMRTRVSSQCLKRHWRVTESPHALQRIDGAAASVRSRETVSRRVIQPLRDTDHDEEVLKAISTAFQRAVYGEKKGDESRQPLLLGEPEIQYLAAEALKIAEEHGTDATAAAKAAESWQKNSKANMKALREECSIPGGIAAALFGRMVTSDVEANIDAAVHVAHAFTVHREESESDYFTVVDDLRGAEDDSGADHIGETELTSGLFYGYVVLDRSALVRNLGNDAEMAGEVARRLVHLIATVTPGAKLGPTAPYGYASWILVEAGDRQPRSLAEAYREPCRPDRFVATQAAGQFLKKVDALYETGETRRFISVEDAEMPGAERSESLRELASWAGAVVEAGSA